MFWKKNRPIKTNSKNKTKKKTSNKGFIFKYVLTKRRKVGLRERIVKFFVWIALRIAIRPKHWKNKRKNAHIINSAYDGVMSKDFIFIPPAFAFYLVMSFMPVILISFTILSMSESLYSYIDENFLHSLTQNISFSKLFNSSLSSIFFTIFIIFVSTWIASAGFAKFIFTLSYLYDHEYYGGFWMNRLRGMMIVLCFSIYLAIGIIGIASVPIVLSSLDIDSSTILYSFLYWVTFIFLGFVYIYIGFVLLFKFAPRFKLTWRQIHPGSTIATIPTLLFLLLFGLITQVFLSYSFFGVLAPFMTLSISLLIISYFIYVGILVNVVFYKIHHSKYTKFKFTFSKK